MSDDDLFGDSRDDFFGDDDDFGGDDFGEFGGFDDFDLGDEEVDAPDFGEDFAAEEQGPAGATIFGLNRNFVLIGGAVAAVVCVAIVLIAVLTLTSGPSDVDLTITAVYATNTAVAQLLVQTETQNAVFLNATATADAYTDTPTPAPTDTPTLAPTDVPATSTPLFVTPTMDPGQGGGGLEPNAVALTATALAGILAGATEAAPAGEFPTPTIDIGGGAVVPGGATPVATRLPTTGLFDDIGTGNGVNGILTAGLALVGLAAVIVVARRLRA